jgi:hypothetical protein
MPKGAKKRAKLKKKQQEGHHDDGGNNASNGNGNGSDDNTNAPSRRDGDHHLRIPPKSSRGTNGNRPSSPIFKPGQIRAFGTSVVGIALFRVRRGWHSLAPAATPHHRRVPTGRRLYGLFALSLLPSLRYMYDGCLWVSDACGVCVWVGAADASEDSMESSEEMVTPRAAASEAEDEERKADAAEVLVERAVPPETDGQEGKGKVNAAVEVHPVATQEPEVKDVVVAEESVVQEPESVEASAVEVPEVKREMAKVHPVHEPEPKVDEVVVVETPVAPVVQEPEVKGDGANVVVQEPETLCGNVVVKDSAEVSRSREAVDVHTTEVDGLCDFSSVTQLHFDFQAMSFDWVGCICCRWCVDLQWQWPLQGSEQHGGIAVGFLMHFLVQGDR